MHDQTFLALATWVLGQAPEDLSSTERLVLIALGEHLAPDTLEAFPSATTLGRMTALNEKTVRRALDSLHDKEVVRKLPQRGGFGSRTLKGVD